MKQLLKNGMVYENGRFSGKDVLIEDGVITGIGAGLPVTDAKIQDLGGRNVVPGFIEIHTHGAVGVDINGADSEALERVSRFFASQGTTSWLSSVLTDTREQTLWCIDQHKKWKRREHCGAELLGIHLEGPFLNPEYAGAMPESLLKKPDAALIQEYQETAEGAIRYLTISPELEGAVKLIPKFCEMGIRVAVGHSGADYETAMEAIRQGARAATHTGNVMKLLHQHYPAIWGAVLEDDRVYCEIICDGRHLHPGTVRLILKTKGMDRVVAITDSIMAAGLSDGIYKLGVNDICVKDGDAKLVNGGNRAGSTLTQIQALRNLLLYTGKPLEELIPLFTENPAKLLGVYDKIGSIEINKDADLTVLEEDCTVYKTFVKGVIPTLQTHQYL